MIDSCCRPHLSAGRSCPAKVPRSPVCRSPSSRPSRTAQVDVQRLREQVEFQIAAGTHCLCPVGTTGESPTLSHEEHERVIAEVVQAARGRIKVMPGTGSNSTAEALRLTKWAAKEGADAALMVAPYYNKPTQEGFFLHYKAVAEQVGIPICVYNIPGRTGKNIEPETIARLAELPNITPSRKRPARSTRRRRFSARPT